MQFVQAYSELFVLCHGFGLVPFLARGSLSISNSLKSPTVVPGLALNHVCISQDCVTTWRSVSCLSVFIVSRATVFLFLQRVCQKILTKPVLDLSGTLLLTVPTTNSFTPCPPNVERSSLSVKIHCALGGVHKQ